MKKKTTMSLNAGNTKTMQELKEYILHASARFPNV